MSLATSGGGGGLGGAGGAGGLAMGHQAAGNAMANLPQAPPPMSGGHAHASSHGATGASGGGVAIEVCDKTQKVSLAKAKSVAHLPICAVDLHAVMPTVALFPPLLSSSAESAAQQPVFLGKMKAKLGFHATETSHKTLRKYLTQTKPYKALKQDSLVLKVDDSHSATASQDNVVVLDRPHAWLGVRRVEQLPKAWQASFTIGGVSNNSTTTTTTTQSTTTSTAAISEEDFTGTNCCWWTNSTLDGSVPDAKKVDYDMDRVVAKVRLQSSKKALTILPEEATQLLLHQARSHVAKYSESTKQDADLDTEDWLTTFPLSIAVPSWAMNDAAMEALYEAAGGSETATVLFPRSVSALIGSLVKPSPDVQHNKFLQRIATVQQALLQQHKIQYSGSKADEPFVANTLFITMGTTPEGCEVTAISCSYPQRDALCFEEYQILANVSEWSDDNNSPASLLPKCLEQLEKVLEMVAPDADGPAAILSFGTTHEQDELTQALKKSMSSRDKNNQWLSKVPVIAASPEAVPTGAAFLGGIALGRYSTSNNNTNELAIRLQSSAMVATGVARYYTPQQVKQAQQPNNSKLDKNIKVIFDFDRRLPAGPYAMEFKASECVVHRKRLADNSNNNLKKGESNVSTISAVEDDEAFLKAVKEAESAKQIPEREKAALEFTVQVFQKYTRNGEWHAVGNPMAPLVKFDTQIDKNTDEDLPETKIACEQATWELSMTVTGTLASSWVGERESVVQAMKSARGRLYEYYGWLAFCVLFFGGFFVKSYWEDHVWKRDTNRLLEYYKHVIPGSIQDGDRDTASWMAYKYRHNKQKLWHNLETKYGIPVPDVWDDVAMAAAAASNSKTSNNRKPNAADDETEVDLDQQQQQQDASATKTEDAPSTDETESDTDEMPDL